MADEMEEIRRLGPQGAGDSGIDTGRKNTRAQAALQIARLILASRKWAQIF